MESSEVQVLLMKSKNILFGKEYWLKSKPTNTFRPMGDGILGSTGTSDEIQSRSFCKECRQWKSRQSIETCLFGSTGTSDEIQSKSFCKECRMAEIVTVNKNLPVGTDMESSEVQVLLTKSKNNLSG